MHIFFKILITPFVLMILSTGCNKKGELEETKLAILLLNSTHEMRRVTFEKRMQNGKLAAPYYLNIKVGAKSKVEQIIDPAVYKIKIWNDQGYFVGHVKDFNFALHDDKSFEHPYYLDLAFNKKYAITNLNFIYSDTSKIDFSDFEIFKIYDAKEPFEIAKSIRYNDIIFLEDHIPHKLNGHKKLYCAYPVPKQLNRRKTHLYLEEQIRVHYEN